MFSSKNEKGQTIILIAVVILGLFALSALVVDGGNAYLNRRKAQTAADAAALAAAYEKCVNNVPASDLQPIVDEYAVNQNRADSATYTFDAPDAEHPKGKITVTTYIERTPFFARIFTPTVKVAASGSAGCYLPAVANSLLPVAWTCRQPIGGTPDTCVIKTIPHSTFDEIVAEPDEVFDFEEDLLDEADTTAGEDMYTATDYYNDTSGALGQGKLVYMLIDDDKFDVTVDCKELNPFGAVTCDFDEDGYLDVEGGANRGWLLLDGTGASDLSALMIDGYPGLLELPQWFPGKSGVSNSVFINAETIKFRISLVPVFNAVCEDTTAADIPINCPEYGGELIKAGTGSGTYYRVPAVAAFVVTCVSKGTPDPCPGKTYSGVDNNTSTIEGYFIYGYSGGAEIGTSGFDLGVYIISLTE